MDIHKGVPLQEQCSRRVASEPLDRRRLGDWLSRNCCRRLSAPVGLARADETGRRVERELQPTNGKMRGINHCEQRQFDE